MLVGWGCIGGMGSERWWDGQVSVGGVGSECWWGGE